MNISDKVRSALDFATAKHKGQMRIGGDDLHCPRTAQSYSMRHGC